ncbi:Rv3235 family protein [Cellulomonas sp. KRMCY2]|uniref:Rv3235 family protein n=1 Tax=Cellulomonas sp. KRMCY2 TaxID=1304865 RepID=UPI00045E7D4D|nr:Rv3235 family protein [Cellulomonas sp. KRMCY2]
MTAATLSVPSRAARRSADPGPGTTRPATTRSIAPGDPGRVPTAPRLLLPPIPEPTAAPLVTALAALDQPTVRSVLSPVTDSLWPVPAPHATGSREPLPDPTRLCGSLVLAAVQALGGGRSLAQLQRWVSPEIFDALAERAAPAALSGAASSRAASSRAARTGPAGNRTATGTSTPRAVRNPTVRRTHLSWISPTTVEASVVVHDGARVRAAAVRLEVHRGHWRATVLQIG